jgi:sulfur carrier protein
MDTSITVYVNGEPRAVAPGLALAALVDAHTPARAGVAVAVDGEVVPRAAWPGLALAEGARVEILTAVQGG